MVKNELEKIWEIAIMPEYLRRGTVRGQWEYYISLFWQLKAKMDLQDALIKEQKKQILDCFADNALLHKRLKKCQEENKRLESLRPLTNEEKEENIQRVINKLKQKGGGR